MPGYGSRHYAPCIPLAGLVLQAPRRQKKGPPKGPDWSALKQSQFSFPAIVVFTVKSRGLDAEGVDVTALATVLESGFPLVAQGRNTHRLFLNQSAKLIDGGKGADVAGNSEKKVGNAVGKDVSGFGHLSVSGGVSP